MTTATVTVASFRLTFPEFQNKADYPDPVVSFQLSNAVGMINANRWGAMTNQGVSLFMGHMLSLGRKAYLAAVNHAQPGVSTGPVNSKSVDKVSIGYDTGSGTFKQEDAAFWNLTDYGKQLYTFMLMFGAGPIQLGVGGNSQGNSGTDDNNISSSAFGPGWYGPWPWPSESGFST